MGRPKKIEVVPCSDATLLTCPVCGTTFEDSEELCFYISQMQKPCSWKCFMNHVRSLPKVEKKPSRRRESNPLTEAWTAGPSEETEK